MKLKYIGASDSQVSWGGCDDPRGLLQESESYAVESIEQHTWHTKIILSAFPSKKFNSVCFEKESA